MEEIKGLDAQVIRHLESSILFADPEQAAMDFEMLICDHWSIEDYKKFLEKINWLLNVQIEASENR
ncbi:hypothetical protein ACFLZU_03770 [Thermodesulfobacteriota bacterium]